LIKSSDGYCWPICFHSSESDATHPEWPEGDQIRGDRSCSQSIVSLAGLRNSQNSETPCRIGGAFSYGPAQS
jgi:hypothetical protein